MYIKLIQNDANNIRKVMTPINLQASHHLSPSFKSKSPSRIFFSLSEFAILKNLLENCISDGLYINQEY